MMSAQVWLRQLPRLAKAGSLVVIDLDGREFRVVQASRWRGRVRIARHAAFEVPGDVDSTDFEAVGRALGRCLGEMGLRGAAVTMAVPRSQAILKPLTLPTTSSSVELAGMVQYQVERELPFSGEEAAIDFVATHRRSMEASDSDQTMEVLVAAVRREVIERYRQIAETAGIRLERLGLRPYANKRCVEAVHPGLDRHCFAVVHITADETEIDVLAAEDIVFTRSALVKVPANEVNPGESDQATQAVVREVTRSLQSYQAVHRTGAIDRVLFAGGTGIERRVAAAVAHTLNLPCEMINPREVLQLKEQDGELSQFVTAMGLALGLGDGAKLPFDFLNPKCPPVRRDWRKIAGLSITGGLVTVLLICLIFGHFFLSGKRARLQELSRRYSELQKQNESVRTLATRVRHIQQWVENRHNWLEHWAHVSGLFPACTEAYISSLSTGQDGTMRFTVRAMSNDTIVGIGQKLSEAGYQYKLGAVTTQRNGANEYIYEAGMQIAIDPKMKIDLNIIEPAARPADDASARARTW